MDSKKYITPKEIEHKLLKDTENLILLQTNENKEDKDKKENDEVKWIIDEDKPKKKPTDFVTFIDPNCHALAMTDLTGRTAKNTDWYRNDLQFTCFHCLQKIKGLCFGLPMRSKVVKNEGLQIIVRGRFGSIACMRAYAEEKRYCFANENAEMTSSILDKVYKIPINIQQKIKRAPKRTQMSEFQDDPKNGVAYKCGSFDVDAQKYIQVPDPKKAMIYHEHSALLINSHIPISSLNMRQGELETCLTNQKFYFG